MDAEKPSDNSDNSQQPNPLQTEPIPLNPHPQQPIFHDIVDVFSECQRGNFKPYLVCLKEGYVSKDYIDPSGYHLIHYGASYNDLPLIYYLLSELQIDVNIRSSSQQTPLMIASNFGLVEIIRLLIEYKADITVRDSCHFTPLMYTVKQNHVPAFIYLLFKGCDPTISDSNGCTLAHWAAFKNNLFLLRICKRLGFNLNSTDSKGYTPFQRAFSNDAYDCIQFLLEEKDLSVLPEKMNVEEIQSESIKLMIVEKINEKINKFSCKRTFWEFWAKNPKRNAFLVYFIIILLGFYGFLNGVFYKPENDLYIMNILFMVMGFYFLLYVYLFIYKLVFPKVKPPENNEAFEENDLFSRRIKTLTTKDALEMGLIDFSALDKILQNSKGLNQAHSSVSIIYEDHNEMLQASNMQWTFLHYISYLIERFRFTEALDVDCNRLCPTCLTFKLAKTKHCRYCGCCVPYFNHHSHIFGRCFDYKNHPYYLILLTLQQTLLVLYLTQQMMIYSSSWTSYSSLGFFETAYLIYNNDGLMVLMVYEIMAVCVFYNSLFWIIECFGVLSNQTYNEIFHRHRYAYLYGNWNDPKGRIWKVYTNQTSQGIRKNAQRYFKRCLA